MITYSVAGLDIKLELAPGVFEPTTTTQLLIEQLGDVKGKTVLDLGCGSGPIAVAAALKGAERVYAVDLMPEACHAALRNVELNCVADQVVVLQGNLFEPLRGFRFDTIVDDVSGMAEEVSRISPWYPSTIPTGGVDGTGPTVQMLQEAPKYLHQGGCLLFPTISLARTEKILAVAREVFGDKLYQVAGKCIPFCEELLRNIDVLIRLKEEGIITFIQKRSRYLWELAIYRGEM